MNASELSNVRWPAGPPVAIGDPGSWVDFKLASTRWYVDTLETLGRDAGLGFGRWFGVEMAIDGALGALCGAVDAAQAPLFRLVWASDGKKARKAPPGSKDFVPKLDERPGPIRVVGQELARAYAEKDGQAIGWLAQVRELRNRSMHEGSLSRHIAVVLDATTSTRIGLSIPGVPEPVDPVTYLRSALGRALALTTLMLDALAQLGGGPTPPADHQSALVRATAATASAGLGGAARRTEGVGRPTIGLLSLDEGPASPPQ